MSEDQTHTNRLSLETSPYLLQHQHNPVDWYAWGPEAFEAARSQNKPIFLSVGYSTCYWCHVMERESFENPAVAAEMNARFICIKVDREERPDVDQLYMTAVQLIARQGGWPMSVWLSPNLLPFYGGTYFPPTDRGNRPGFVSLLQGIEDAYKNRPLEVKQSAEQITDLLTRLAVPRPAKSLVTIDDVLVERLIVRSADDYDPRAGGFGAAPKFPRQTLLELLLVYNRNRPDAGRLRQVTHTLDCLAHGGIRDQLGGGFHRYSTDAEWLVPHFEIMLYDNAMLAWCYVEAYRQTEDRRYAAVARGVFDFVLRDMTSPEGAFYTAFDAEVDAQEGLSYLWTRSEVEATLAEALTDDATAEAQIHRFCRVYGLDDGPNFADPHHGNGMPEKNILFITKPQGSTGPVLLDPELAKLRSILLTARAQRKQPLLDTKIITSWNALMIRALAFGGQILQDRTYIDAAAKAADFLLTQQTKSDNTLYRTSRGGVKKYDGFLDDYAFLIQAMIALHDAGASERWKDAARSLSKVMLRKFYDPDAGGFFFTDIAADDLIVRQKVAHDSPLPSGNGIAALSLLALKDPDPARSTLGLFAEQLQEQAEGMSALLQAAVAYLRDHPPITVTPSAPPQPASADVVTMAAEWSSPTDLAVTVTVGVGYHINAHDPAPDMVATTLAVPGHDTEILYPPAENHQLGTDTIPVYTGVVTFRVRFTTPPPPGTEVQLALTSQACDNSACQRPTTARITAATPV